MMPYYFYNVSFLCVCVSVYIFIIFARTLYIYAMCLMSLTDSIDRMVSITFWSNDRAAPQTVIQIILY